MSKTTNEIVVHLSESVDEITLDDLEQDIRRSNGIIAVTRRPDQKHLIVVVYDSAITRAAGILNAFQVRGLHAQLIGM